MIASEIKALAVKHQMRIVSGGWVVGDSCCPISLLMIDRFGRGTWEYNSSKFGTARAELGPWVQGFIHGFDSKEKITSEKDYTTGYSLGVQMRKELL